MSDVNIETVEWFDDRFYKITKKDLTIDYYPSVTTILGIINKPWLLKWYGDLGTERAKYQSKLAKERGSLIHEGINNLLKTGYCSSAGFTQEDYFQIWNFTRFYESVKPKIFHNEIEVFNHGIRSAGTLDILCYIEDGVYDIGYQKPETLLKGNYVIDVKTGNMDKSYFYQIAAYAKMAIENGLIEHIQGTAILQTNADTKKNWKLIVRSPEQVENDYECFLSALTLYRANGEDKPKVFEMPAELIIKEIKDKEVA